MKKQWWSIALGSCLAFSTVCLFGEKKSMRSARGNKRWDRMIHKQSSNDFQMYVQRREKLCDAITKQYPGKKGLVLLLSGFEYDSARAPFHQEASFYYLTGIEEPGLAFVIDLETKKTTLYVPNCGTRRAQWVHQLIPLVADSAGTLCVDAVVSLGDACAGYALPPAFEHAQCKKVCERLSTAVAAGQTVFTLNPTSSEWQYVEQRRALARYQRFVPG